jgi:hypothetical protein
VERRRKKIVLEQSCDNRREKRLMPLHFTIIKETWHVQDAPSPVEAAAKVVVVATTAVLRAAAIK